MSEMSLMAAMLPAAAVMPAAAAVTPRLPLTALLSLSPGSKIVQGVLFAAVAPASEASLVAAVLPTAAMKPAVAVVASWLSTDCSSFFLDSLALCLVLSDYSSLFLLSSTSWLLANC